LAVFVFTSKEKTKSCLLTIKVVIYRGDMHLIYWRSTETYEKTQGSRLFVKNTMLTWGWILRD